MGHKLSEQEKVARDRLNSAIAALRSAIVECEAAGLGSQVLGPLQSALSHQECALYVIEGWL